MKKEYLKKVYPLLLIAAMYVVYQYRLDTKEESKLDWKEIHKHRKTITGKTMGTTYTIVCYDSIDRDLKLGIDSLLVSFNDKLSTYIPTSEISRFNNKHYLENISLEFLTVVEKSREIYRMSGGAFDPTVMPLVNLWGFGYKKVDALPDTNTVLLVKDKIGFNQVQGSETLKAPAFIELGFGAIAKGYGVDLVGEFLESRGVTQFLIEIGGENLMKGVKPDKALWTLKILYPEQSKALLEQGYCGIALTDCAMATSGPYAQQKEINGVKYSHTIDPRTGFPVKQELLSISVLAKDCMTADGIATALNVMSLVEAKQFLQVNPEFEAMLLYEEDGAITEFITPGFREKMFAL